MQNKKNSNDHEHFALQEILLEKHSRAHRRQILQWIYEEKYAVKTLMHLFLSGNHKVAGRAAATVNDVAEKYPDRIQPYLTLIVDRLSHPEATKTLKRNGMRVLQFTTILPTLHAKIMDLAFHFFLNSQESIAVRVLSIGILHRLSFLYPEIIPELEATLKHVLGNQPSPGLKHQIIKVLQQQAKSPELA